MAVVLALGVQMSAFAHHAPRDEFLLKAYENGLFSFGSDVDLCDDVRLVRVSWRAGWPWSI